MAAPVLGPCQSWISGADVVACCPAAVDADSDALDAVGVEASMMLFELSGRQFNGACEETVRPCRSSCGAWGAAGVAWHWGSWYVGPDWSFPLWGWGAEGVGQLGCGCSALSEVPLVYPVAGVSAVTIDGVTLDGSEYRVDEYRSLVRVWDASFTPPRPRWWPSCQNLGLAATEPGTFSVTYTHGVAPPPLGVRAAAQLACQLWLSCNNAAACILPTGASQITRQGVRVERGLLAQWFQRTRYGKGWLTGMPAIDAFLTAYNPNAIRRAPAVFSPDLTRYPRRVDT